MKQLSVYHHFMVWGKDSDRSFVLIEPLEPHLRGTEAEVDEFQRIAQVYAHRAVLLKTGTETQAAVVALLCTTIISTSYPPQALAVYDHRAAQYRVVWRRKRIELSWKKGDLVNP